MKPELVVSIPNINFFNAALRGGADGFAFGLPSYNLDPSNSHFNLEDIVYISQICKSKDKKIYIFCNKVILNEELHDLIETIDILSQDIVAGIIIQDLGLYHILHTHFPSMNIIADSTMNFNNTMNVALAEKMNLGRVALSRELFLNEIEKINEKTNIPLELHYYQPLNFSKLPFKMISFVNETTQKIMEDISADSFLSDFDVISNEKFLFSLKDSVLLEYIPRFKELDIHSIHIESKLNSTEYIYLLTKAYRIAIDESVKDGKAVLNLEETKNLSASANPRSVNNSLKVKMSSSILLGTVKRSENGEFSFNSSMVLKSGYHINIYSEEGDFKHEIELDQFDINQRNFVKINTDYFDIERGDIVFLTKMEEEKHTLDISDTKTELPKPKVDIQKIITGFQLSMKDEIKKEIFVRIDSIAWLRKVYLRSIDRLILKFPKRQWNILKIGNPYIIRNKHKLIIELPEIILDDEIEFYEKLCKKFHTEGFKEFMISHIGHKDIIPSESIIYLNEKTPISNDAAIHFIKEQHFENWVLPYNQHVNNLINSNNQQGIVPLYYQLALINSRVPLKFPNNTEEIYEYDEEHTMLRFKRDGITTIIEDKPQSHFHQLDVLKKKGYKRFLIDLSFTTPSQNTFNTLIGKLEEKKEERFKPRSNQRNGSFRNNKRTNFKPRFNSNPNRKNDGRKFNNEGKRYNKD